MKTIRIILTAMLLTAGLYIVACTSGRKASDSILSGRFIMQVIERDVDDTVLITEAESDTTFNSFFRALNYIPDNTEWDFTDDSVLIVSKADNDNYEPDTVVYKISRKGDSLLILSGDFVEKFSLRKIDANRVELDFGDPSFSYQLIRVP